MFLKQGRVWGTDNTNAELHHYQLAENGVRRASHFGQIYGSTFPRRDPYCTGQVLRWSKTDNRGTNQARTTQHRNDKSLILKDQVGSPTGTLRYELRCMLTENRYV